MTIDDDGFHADYANLQALADQIFDAPRAQLLELACRSQDETIIDVERCHGLTKQGHRCLHARSDNSLYCRQHEYVIGADDASG